MPLIGLSHRVSFTFDNESEAHDCFTRLQDELPDLVLDHQMGKDISESWTLRSDVDSDSTGPQIQALADAAILFGPVEYAARQVAETQPD